MRVLLVGTYELGRQPVSLAQAAAALEAAGHDVECVDLSVEQLDPGAVARASAVALSVPMHTAMRMALALTRRIREAAPGVPVCLFGLYAMVGRGNAGGDLVDHRIAGEFETPLVAWVDGLAAGWPPAAGAVVDIGRRAAVVPSRVGLPPLERYARLAAGGSEVLAAAVEASRGCAHRCRHCPVPVVYDGRVRPVDEAIVLADVERVVAAGARHISFSDPDFLNMPQHARRVVRAVHEAWPHLTFDCTTKVEHVLRHASAWPELAAAGCRFVVSAIESTSDAILERLAKGHTAAQASAAIRLLRSHGIETRPSFLPFTPWTTLDDLCDLCEFIRAHDLVPNVDPVQLTIRLLVPEGSLLADHPDMAPWLGPYDGEHLGYRWTSADPRVDEVHEHVAELVEGALARDEAHETTFALVERTFARAAGRRLDGAPHVVSAGPADRPRITEAWFCCAEPTSSQLASSGGDRPSSG